MSRAKKMRMRQVRRNRRIAVVVIIIFAAFLLSVIFNHLNVMAERPQTYKYYTDIRVQRNDTLWTIAEKYMSEEYKNINEYVREVREINHVGNQVEYGQRLMIPYYSDELK